MWRHSIPTARFAICESPEEARAALEREFDFPVVVKADGLAAGKGVRIVTDQGEFEEAINAMMVERVFGPSGSRIVLEERLFGQEASVMLFTDGRDYRLIAPARDYKRAYDGDLGPNTGGMGSFSTPGLIPDDLMGLIRRRIIEPTLEGMAAEGNPFSGALYLGLMLTESGPMVLEYNARLGDPETQAVIVRLASDLVEICEAIVDRRVGQLELNWSGDSAVCVVLAAGGYPGHFEKGKLIEGIEAARSIEGVVIFHAGTARDQRGRLITAGGRVLGVTARAPSVEAARARAYEAVSKISFDRMHYRRDIAGRS
jgi:phosphoribosylamine--glycine ligase